ncbi:hypothetical protein SAMN05660462_02904 [Proteiniborus ethanoligenes]|uniref:Uncharacterized protein n=1 Tax=Proteiniborus ethanoligenes TaxID=415015 RepID=A0A1H3SH30_9FIRM|nr:hypothetical protein SAMN05660462_02904 [Proteiniborus ethanoligenes]
MDYRILGVFILLTILVSIQYSLNRIIIELREIKKILLQNKIRN